MLVRFLQDYQGQHTGPHFFLAGEEAELDDYASSHLIADGRAVEVKAAPKVQTRRKTKDTGK